MIILRDRGRGGKKEMDGVKFGRENNYHLDRLTEKENNRTRRTGKK